MCHCHLISVVIVFTDAWMNGYHIMVGNKIMFPALGFTFRFSLICKSVDNDDEEKNSSAAGSRGVGKPNCLPSLLHPNVGTMHE